MKIDKKVHLNILDIMLGTKCNLNCKHCMGGHPKKHMVITENIIDCLLQNITGICTLRFMGYEISFYKQEIRMILDKIQLLDIQINEVAFFTNGAIFDVEFAELFNDFKKCTTHPDQAVFQVSGDSYHLNSGFTDSQRTENIKKYTDILGDAVRTSNMDVGLVIAGNAKNMQFDELKEEHITIPYGCACFKSFRNKCNGEGGICKGAANCIVNPIIVTPNGQIYTQDLCAYTAVSEGNFSHSIGNVLEKSLYEIIDNAKDSKPMHAIYRDTHSKEWQSRRLTYHYMLVREKLLDAITGVQFDSYIDAIRLFMTLSEYYRDGYKSLENDADKTVLKNCFTKMEAEYKDLLKLAKIFFRSNTNEQKRMIRQIPNLLKNQDSFFSPEKFSKEVFPYEKFKKLWEYYYAADFENFKKLNSDLDKSLKLEATEI